MSMSTMPDCQIPLVVGVTGHRDLLEEELVGIEKAVNDFIDELLKRYPDLPLLFLTGLAEGADSLVAKVASKRGCEVRNVLPMPITEYRKDFSGDAAAKFEELEQLNETIELPVAPQTGQSAELPATVNRNVQYARLGVFLAAHCHLLLALWDGRESSGTGGTAEVVRFHQRDITTLAGFNQERPRLDVADDESDLVFHITCSRRSGSSLAGLQPCEAQWLSRDDADPRTAELPPRYDRVFQRMAEFNRDANRPSSNAGIEQLVPETVPGRAQAVCTDIQLAFGYCDFLAQYFQRCTLSALRLTLGAALAAGLAFIVYADFENQHWAIFAYFVFIALSIGAFRVAELAGWQRKYVDYRVLAEALRVQYYWALGGISMDNPSRFSHDRFFNGRDLDLGWIRNVLRFTGLRSDSEQLASAEDIQLAAQYWVGSQTTGQFGYYHLKSRQKLRQHTRTGRITTACFVAGLLSACVLAVASHSLPGVVVNLLVATMGLLPLVAAARQNYAHRIAQRELVAQYDQMHNIFSFAARLLQNAVDSKDKQSILQELGEAALNENAQWVLRQRERPLPGSDAMA